MNIQFRILQTLELFAAQHMAVTVFELHKFLVRDKAVIGPNLGGEGNLVDVVEGAASVAFDELLSELFVLVRERKVVDAHGYYTLPEEKELIERRWRGYQYGVWREKRIRRFMSGLQFLPFVRGVAVAGSQAMGLERKESDIDLFIVTAPGWLWLPRTLVTGYFQLLGIRRHDAYIADRVCLNHYVAGPKKMAQGRNWYTALEYAKLRPLYGADEIARFQIHNEAWIQSFFPNFTADLPAVQKRGRVQQFVELLLERTIGRTLEKLLGDWQGKRIHKEERHIMVAEDELSFHPNSKQDALLKAFQ